MNTAFLSRKLTPEDYLVIVTNLVPVFGAWFLNWSAIEVFTVYALETLITGVLTVIKLAVTFLGGSPRNEQSGKPVSFATGLFFILFFIAHFGLFALVQTAIFSATAGIAPAGTGLFYFFFHWYDYLDTPVTWMLLAYIVSYILRDLFPFFRRREYRTASPAQIMFRPYGRIIIQQFTVILGSMFLVFGLGKIFILVFALVKIFIEVWFNPERFFDRAFAEEKERSGQQ